MILQSRFEDAADAAALVGRGPEALQSQFRSGYGMALNLLHTRTLDEARAFIQRSFDNYLGAALRALCLLRRPEVLWSSGCPILLSSPWDSFTVLAFMGCVPKMPCPDYWQGH